MAKSANPDLLLGVHVSIAGGMDKAPERGRESGCSAIQVFTQSPSQWAAKPLTAEDGQAFQAGLTQHKIRSVIAHDIYLINLAAPREDLWEKSIVAFADELGRCHTMGIDALVAHPGAHMKEGEDWGIARIATALDRVFASLPKQNRVKVLLETTAGMGSSIGHRFEHLAGIRKASRFKRRIAYCLDTAHVLAAGYEFRDADGYLQTTDEFDRICGLKNLLAIHLNDSKRDVGTRVDRHDRFGKGFIGKRPLAWWAGDPRLVSVPKVMEVPGDPKIYKSDIAAVRRLANKEMREKTHPIPSI